ncbi:MAG: type II secretion system protein [Phycisphaerae bacterium]|jgi:prepilin-type N-terminal cleavage/methylation domain-containing protein/prepilin-type processing-associated H-X9-DG protein
MNGQTREIKRHTPGRISASPRPAFTLVEMLLVIAIMGILVAILSPSLIKTKLLAAGAACGSNLRTLGIAAATYQTVYRQYVPICWKNLEPTYAHPWKSWRAGLLPFAPGVGAFNCAAVTAGNEAAFLRTENDITGMDWLGTSCAGSYGVMYQESRASFKTVNFNDVMARGHPSWSQAYPAVAGMAWADPANSVYIADASLTSGPITYPTQSYKGYGTSAIVPPSDPGYLDVIRARRFSDRHNGTNCLFVDGHVSAFDTPKLDAMVTGQSDCIWDMN